MVFAGQVLPGLPFLPLHSFTPRRGLRRGLEVLGTATAVLPCDGLWAQPCRAVCRSGVLCLCGSQLSQILLAVHLSFQA